MHYVKSLNDGTKFVLQISYELIIFHSFNTWYELKRLGGNLG